MSLFKDKNIVISGASRGIGLSIAKKLAHHGANIAILAKTDIAHSKLPGTIYTAAKEIENFGVKVIPIKTDIRFDDQVEKAINKIYQEFVTLCNIGKDIWAEIDPVKYENYTVKTLSACFSTSVFTIQAFLSASSYAK